LEGHGVQSKQDLIDFVALADGTPYPKWVDGEIVSLDYESETKASPASISITVETVNGDKVLYTYYLLIEDAAAYLAEAKQSIGERNLLTEPLSTADGRLTLHTETREYNADSEVQIMWWGEIDGNVISLAYFVSDGSAVDTAALLESLEIMESIVPQFPKYAWANTKFGAFVDRPRYEIYATADAPGNSFGHVDPEWMFEEYSDQNAKQTITVTHQGKEYELEYQHSMPAIYTRQAYHVYESESTEAWLDAETGSVMYLSLPIKRDELGEALTQDELVQVANDFFATLVKDPEAYSAEVNYYESSGGASVKFVRYVGDLPSCDSATVFVMSDGQIDYYVLNYLGAMRNAQPIPDSTRDHVIAVLENMIKGFEKGSYELGQYALTLDGCLALDCNVDVRYTDSDGMQWGDGAWMLFTLTELYSTEQPTQPDSEKLEDPEMNLDRIRYAWDDVEFGEFLSAPEFHVYHSNYFAAPGFEDYEVDINVLSEKYQDPSAPLTATVKVGEKEYVLNYTHSRTHGKELSAKPMLQAAHCYRLDQDDVVYKAELDQKTGACIAFSTEQGILGWEPMYTDEQVDEIATNLWQTFVPDFENYRMPKRLTGYNTYWYHEVKSVSIFTSCEEITIEINRYNGAIEYRLNFLGAMRNIEQIPDTLIAQVQEIQAEKFPSDDPSHPWPYSGYMTSAVITEEGRLALEYDIFVPYLDPETGKETQDCLYMLIYLTEPMK
jgi:hypothetical protein